MKPLLNLACAFLFLSAPIYAAAAGQNAPESFQLDQCVAVQLKPAVVYVSGAADYLEAFDALTGKRLWKSNRISCVLLARGKKLLAAVSPQVKGHSCMLAVLDSRTGKILSYITGPAAYPPNCVGDSINSSYGVSAFSADGHDYLRSTYSWRPFPSGVNRGPDYREPPGSYGSSSASWEVDMQTSGIKKTGADTAGYALDMLPNTQGGYHSETFTVDGMTAQTDMVLNTGTSYKLLLKRWKDGEALPDITMTESPWNSAGTSVSLDRRYALAVYQEEHSFNPIMYKVSVFSVVTGEKISSFDAKNWPLRSVVVGNILISYFPWVVFCTDLKTGMEKWSKPVRDLQYRGPYPP